MVLQGIQVLVHTIVNTLLTTTTPALTRECEDEHMLSSEACAVSRPLFFHTVDSPCSHPRATASEDNAALGLLTGKPAGARPDYRGRWCANQEMNNTDRTDEMK
ncbi:UNVERIFIED_CONTAM: hypothetical protein FKN15_077470 [Acipenser sinensis]